MPAVPEQRRAVLEAAIAAVVAFVFFNGAFYWLSGNYFQAHFGEYTPERMSHVRMVFALASAVIIAVNFLIGLHRRIGAHALAIVLGASNLVGGVASLVTGLPMVLGITQLIAGALMPVLAWFSYRQRRAPWAFLVGMCGVFAVVDMFGAPKIGTVLAINLWTTMIIPGLYAVACVALIQLRGGYAERDLSAV